MGTLENRGWKFTPAHWQIWLARHNAEPDANDARRAAGIDEFHSLLNNK